MRSDIEIALGAEMEPIQNVASKLDIKEEELDLYGRYKAKLTDDLWERVKDRPDGKLILVTAINPTPAGEGKTTTTVGLGQAMDKLGKKALSFLQYLIVNHGRNISSEELMEQFWPEADSSNPANSLKNMMFKTRSLLKGYGSGIGKFDSNPSGLLFLESLCGSGGRFGAL